ncbi:hypothetical protein EXN66_Car007225 [Channa argus]|uniref:Uncharacterized protein n=1 Tax=Channa argus TaxID=215402 RepID=A0A6G1PML7_CHAAH|nr:hypothetical protein EXN66_Car007225 [Channa argus]
MNSSEPLPLRPVKTSCFPKQKEGYALNQVGTYKVPNMQRIMQGMQWAIQKSCSRACQLFCCPIDSLLCEKTTEAKSTQVALRNPPSTILIVNISNSTLIDCVIGNTTYPSAAAENHMRYSCPHGQQGSPQTSPPPPPPPLPPQEFPRISIHSSHLNCVIIGDNNHMHAEQTHLPDTEEQQM